MSNLPGTPSRKFASIGMALGLLFGGLVGLFIDNLVVFAGGGMVIGLALGMAIDMRSTGSR